MHRRIGRLAFNSMAILIVLAYTANQSCQFALAVPTNRAAEQTVYKLCTESEGYSKQDDFDKSIEVLRRAASYDPTSYSSWVHLSLAESYKALKSYKDAEREARLAIKFDPSNDRAVYELAMILDEMDRDEESIKYLKQYVKMTKDPQARKSAEDYIAKTVAYGKLREAQKKIVEGKHAEALSLLKVAASVDPSPYSAPVHTCMSYVYQHLGEPEKAIAEGLKAADLDPNDKFTAYNLVVAYQDIAKFDDAIKWLHRYQSLEPDEAQRKSLDLLLKELERDRLLCNDKDNKLPDYLDQMEDLKARNTWSQARMPLTVCIKSGAGVKGYQPQFRAHVLHGLDTWCKASGKKINYKVVKDLPKADIVVSFTENELGEGSEKSIRAGLTRVEGILANQIDSAKVQIRTVKPLGNNNETVKSGECASVCLHEIGHALGLGHSSSIYDVMYFRSSSKQKGILTNRDTATMARLYEKHKPVNFIPNDEATPEGPPVKFLPPPTFVPPKPPNTNNIAPPLFVPPPVVPERKLQPPLFTPPPVSATRNQSTQPASSPAKAAPLFTPPAVTRSRKSAAPLFLPPPVNR